MKLRYLLIPMGILFLFLSDAQSQDRLIRKDGKSHLVKIVRVTHDKVFFEQYDVSMSPTYELEHSRLDRILYENGSVDYFSDEEGLVMSGPLSPVKTPKSQADSRDESTSVSQSKSKSQSSSRSQATPRSQSSPKNQVTVSTNDEVLNTSNAKNVETNTRTNTHTDRAANTANASSSAGKSSGSSAVEVVTEVRSETQVDDEPLSFEEELRRANRMGRNIFSAKIHFNNREAKENGWLPLTPLFNSAFTNMAFSYERVSENGLLSVEFPLVLGWGNHRAKQMELEDFINEPEVTQAEAAELLEAFQIDNYQQLSMRFKIFPNGQEQVSYFIGPFITASRGDYSEYNLANGAAFEAPILQLETTRYYSAAAGLHNGVSLSPANFITFNLGGGLGLQIFNTADKGFERAPAYYLDFGMGLRF